MTAIMIEPDIAAIDCFRCEAKRAFHMPFAFDYILDEKAECPRCGKRIDVRKSNEALSRMLADMREAAWEATR